MTRDDFLNLPEWHVLATRMMTLIGECDEEILTAPSYDKVRELVGRKNAFLVVLNLPGELISDGEKKARPEMEKVVELPNHPRTVRSAY